MDLRDIQRLHQQYAQGPLTIDMEAASIPAALPAPAARPVAVEGTAVPRPPGYFVENRKVIGLMLVVAAVALPVGMFLASVTKQSNAVAATAPADEQPALRKAADGGPTDAGWPDTRATTPTESPRPVPEVVAPSAPTAAPQANPQSPPAAAVPAPQVRASTHEPKSVAPAPRKPEAPARAAVPTQKPAASASEIKLF